MNFDVESEDFENIFFNPFDSQNIFRDENNDPDINFRSASRYWFKLTDIFI